MLEPPRAQSTAGLSRRRSGGWRRFTSATTYLKAREHDRVVGVPQRGRHAGLYTGQLLRDIEWLYKSGNEGFSLTPLAAYPPRTVAGGPDQPDRTIANHTLEHIGCTAGADGEQRGAQLLQPAAALNRHFQRQAPPAKVLRE